MCRRRDEVIRARGDRRRPARRVRPRAPVAGPARCRPASSAATHSESSSGSYASVCIEVSTAAGAASGHAVEQRDRVVDVERGIRHDVIARDARGERVEQPDGVVDDVLAARLVAVHQPLRELELGVQARPLARPRVGRAAAVGDVRGVDVVRRGRRRREPLQVGGRVADREAVPLEQPGDLRDAVDVLEEEGCRARAAEHDGRLEAPELVGGDRAAPALEERLRGAPGRLGAVDQRGRCRRAPAAACARAGPRCGRSTAGGRAARRAPRRATSPRRVRAAGARHRRGSREGSRPRRRASRRSPPRRAARARGRAAARARRA